MLKQLDSRGGFDKGGSHLGVVHVAWGTIGLPDILGFFDFADASGVDSITSGTSTVDLGTTRFSLA